MHLPHLIAPVQFPDPVISTLDGVVAIGGDLSVDTLLKAYSKGIFPWFSEEDPFPVWWCPPSRMVLVPGQHKVSKSMQQIIRSGKFTYSFDTCFEEVITYCAGVYRKDQKGTWLTPEMRSAYLRLHQSGYAHSLEIWNEGKLAGGLYGVSLGKVFCGESMFSIEPNASKFAFSKLSEFLEKEGFKLIDCQNHTPHLESLGAGLISRENFLEILHDSLQFPTKKGPWNRF